ncbi:MAG: rhodanese-like domain-containing protein [Pseudomonadota bacterium]
MSAWMVRFTGFLIGIFIAVAASAAPTANAQWIFGGSLSEIETRLADKHEEIAHITTDEFVGRGAPGVDYILLDVREEKEFEVSHIPGAVRVDPDASASDVGALLADKNADLPVILYCSVGTRSSRLGTRIANDIDTREIANLRGGVFAWHNENRPLENAAGTTDYIHPYSRWRKGLIERDEKIATRLLMD